MLKILNDADVPQQSSIKAISVKAEVLVIEQSLDAEDSMTSGRPPHITQLLPLSWMSLWTTQISALMKNVSPVTWKKMQLRELRELADKATRLEIAEAKLQKSNDLTHTDLNDSSNC